jgi:SulP family sulfate permease
VKLPKLPPHLEDFAPKLVTCLRDYSPRTLGADVLAGVTVGLVALPLAMAFAIASGMPPQAGIYGAIVAGFLISALGGSRTQIGGPTGAFVVVVAGIIAKYGVDGLFMCTLMAGVVLMAMGLTGLGSAVDYIPRPVVIGFTNGIAVLIASTQLRDFFGLHVDHVPGEFIGRMRVLFEARGTWLPLATALAAGTLAVIALMRRLSPRVPGVVVALVAGTAVAWLGGLGVETIGTRFGGIPTGLPRVVVPHFRPDLILPLLAPTVAIAMLGAIESLLSAVVADHMSGDKHNPNVELFAQGVANVCSPLVGGLPATGAIARTATNIRMGAQTPVSGIVHALTLLALLLVASPLAAHVPLAVLAGILMVVAYNMGAWSETREILRLSKADVSVWLITFVLTVLADLEVAVQSGMILAALLYIRKVTMTTTVSRVTPGVRAGRLPAQPADEPDAGWRRRVPHPWAVPVRLDREARAGRGRAAGAAARRRAAAAQHDRNRRDGAPCARAARRPRARIGARAGAVRHARPAGAAHGEGEVPRAHRRRQHRPVARSGDHSCARAAGERGGAERGGVKENRPARGPGGPC